MENMENTGGQTNDSETREYAKPFRVELPDGTMVEASSKAEARKIIEEYREGNN